MLDLNDTISRLRILDKHYTKNSQAIDEALTNHFDKWLEENLSKYERSQRMINIQIISKCNLHCTFCRGGMNKDTIADLSKVQTMTTDKFKDIVSRCIKGGITVIDLTPAIGEVMLDSDLFAKLDYLENQKSIKVFVLTTNLLKLNVADITKLASYKKIFLAISVYGYDVDSYKIHTNRNQFDRFYENLKILYNTIISTSFNGKIEFTMRCNVSYNDKFPNNEMYYILKAFKHLGFTRINNGEIKNINRANNLINNNSKTTGRSGICIHGPGSGGGITQSGDFLFCPFNDITQKGVMGNIFTTSLRDILSGDKMRELLHKQANNIYDGICENCNETW